jgi:peptidoglycan hydrolase-like protein with peptidoglycan-binding domain
MQISKMLGVAALGVALLAGPAVAYEDHEKSTAHSLDGTSVRSAQQALKDAGYYQGTIDGIAGPETREAVRKYQEAQGLETTGTLDRNTMAKLQPAGASEATRARGTVKEAQSEAERMGRSAKQPVREASGAAEEGVDTGKGYVKSAGQEAEKAGGVVKERVKSAGGAVGEAVDEVKGAVTGSDPDAKPDTQRKSK